MFSIDQNCHSLWDVIPKVQALARKGLRVTQYIEDIDVAFTSMGSDVHAGALHLERERFHRSGGADWGAALFYSEFLGKLPVEIRDWEPYTGMKTAALAKQLERSVDDLYDEFSPGDNWQLIGPSYVGDQRRHRTMGDLGGDEVADFIRQIVGTAKEDVLRRFPEQASRLRLLKWFEDEEQTVGLVTLPGTPSLDDVYWLWLDGHFGSNGNIQMGDSSGLFCTTGNPAQTQLLEVFIRHYDLAADLYNRAIEEAHMGLHRLDKAQGELPFFGVYTHEEHSVRSSAVLEDGAVRIADKSFKLTPDGGLPVRQMADAGVLALAGKAILLVIQARVGPQGQPLALPYHGSNYMPAAHALQRMLDEHGLLPKPVQPIIRVRFHLLDRLRRLSTTICLPDHLVPYFGRQEIPARELGENWQAIKSQAAERLERFRDEAYRRQWERQAMPELAAEIDALDHRRRQLATVNPKAPEIREVWKEIKPRKLRQLDGLVRQIARDWQVRDLDYWDSRGALLPWSIALGGEAFYNQLLDEANVYAEPPQAEIEEPEGRYPGSL